MKVKLLAGVATAGLLAAGAAAAEPNGWYGAIDAGWHTADVETARGVDFETDDGWAAFSRLGYRFNENWRVELEGGHRAGGDLEAVTFSGGANALCASPSAGSCDFPGGEITSTTLMVNVLFDFGSADSALRPFIGLGAGVNRVNTEIEGAALAGAPGIGISADDSSADLAAQAIAGLSWAISDRAHLDLTYRYLMSNMEFDTVATGPTGFDGTYEGRYTDHSLSLGLRYAFGAAEPAYVPPPPPPPPVTPPPPPPPPPPPQPAPTARQFVVYFDWDRSDLTAEASSVVTQAANYAKSGRPTRILVVGHADTSGSAAYNVGLSNRRARTVADALVAQGVNGGVISLDGKGETQLARPTADGVREPLNRRATIDINF